MKSGIRVWLLLAPMTTAAFKPLMHPEPRLKKGDGCGKIYDFANQRLDANFQEKPFGLGGNVGLGGGIETAIDDDFCKRMLHDSKPQKFDADCQQLHEAVRRSADFWADRHPAIYFNWTEPISDTASAELVITADWDDFSRRRFGNTIAFETYLSESESKEVSGTCCGHTHPFTEVGRHTIVFNPFICYHFSRAMGNACVAANHFRFTAFVFMILSLVLLALSLAYACLSPWTLMQPYVSACPRHPKLTRSHLLTFPPPPAPRMQTCSSSIFSLCLWLCAYVNVSACLRVAYVSVCVAGFSDQGLLHRPADH